MHSSIPLIVLYFYKRKMVEFQFIRLFNVERISNILTLLRIVR